MGDTTSVVTRPVAGFKFAPLNLLDIVNGQNLSLSAEYRINGHRSLQLETSLFFPVQSGSVNDSTPKFDDRAKGGKLKLEYRIYINRIYQPLTGLYGAFEAVAIHRSFYTKAIFRPLNGSFEDDYTDEIRIRKNKYFMNFKLGYQVNFGPFLMDLYMGLGIGAKIVKHYDVNKLHPDDEFRPEILNLGNKEGTRLLLGLPFNIKFGFLI